jgi:bifunctional DNA-binding transcriptional regulator/antitoxin component of YhaV-PrlF toxin-antitoxin module
MQWRLSCTKENGELRKQCLQWQVPKKVREALRLADGDRCHIEIQLAGSQYTAIVKLTSGAEFRLPHEIGKNLKFLSKQSPKSFILFSLHPKPSLDVFEQDLSKIQEARKLSSGDRRKILSTSPRYPKRIEVTATVFARNEYVVAEVLERANGVCERCNSKATIYSRLR